MKTGVFRLFLLAFLWKTLNIAFADSEIVLLPNSDGLKDQRNGYCYSIFKPLLEILVEQKEYSNAKHEQNVKLISSLQTQLAIAEGQIKNKIDLITQKDEQIKDKNELIIMKNNQIQVQSEQIKNNENEINTIKNETKSIFEKLNTAKKLFENFLSEWCPSEEGIFKLYLRGVNAFEAPCSKDGWMIIQKRIDGHVDFNRTWEDYRNGFGDIQGEFFIGLEKLHLITKVAYYELCIELEDINGTTSFAHYDNFEIGSEMESYYLKSIGNYNGIAGDSLSYHNGSKFSTFDVATDSGNCIRAGGWWYNDDSCGYSALNAQYYKDGIAEESNGIVWGHWHNFDYTISLTFAQMMIKPKNVLDE
ncbi:microfibril-associated glycoprotein 4-like [Drosophila serrata]|uniref:microfibril-associated glycoprotein 4-like n=1 Tax=Drosophila serrata TaxID=7274 RepID=UPI000A1CF4C3|nr:microfibril-associated glycoprotein 4-like [Drosophila serrata]